MGRPGELDYPEVQSAIEQVHEAGRRLGKPGGIHVVEPDPDQLRRIYRGRLQFSWLWSGYSYPGHRLPQSYAEYKGSSMNKLVISTSSFDVDNNPPLQHLLKEGMHITRNSHGRKLTEDETIALLGTDTVGMIAGIEPLTERVFASAKSLKVVSRCGSGAG